MLCYRVRFCLQILQVQIPASLGDCIKLEYLFLNKNNLQGKCGVHATLLLLPGNLRSKILHTRTSIGTESSKKTLGQQLFDCKIFV
jgi:hypothetical protein